MEYVMVAVVLLVLLALQVIAAFIRLYCRRRLVQNLIWSLLNGQGTQGYAVAFTESTPEQLLYPLTDEQLHTIRACRSFERTTAELKGMRLLDGLLNACYFTVHYDICGTLPSGETFEIREGGYLRVYFSRAGHLDLILWIDGSRKPF